MSGRRASVEFPQKNKTKKKTDISTQPLDYNFFFSPYLEKGEMSVVPAGDYAQYCGIRANAMLCCQTGGSGTKAAFDSPSSQCHPLPPPRPRPHYLQHAWSHSSTLTRLTINASWLHNLQTFTKKMSLKSTQRWSFSFIHTSIKALVSKSALCSLAALCLFYQRKTDQKSVLSAEPPYVKSGAVFEVVYTSLQTWTLDVQTLCISHTTITTFLLSIHF